MKPTSNCQGQGKRFETFARLLMLGLAALLLTACGKAAPTATVAAPAADAAPSVDPAPAIAPPDAASPATDAAPTTTPRAAAPSAAPDSKAPNRAAPQASAKTGKAPAEATPAVAALPDIEQSGEPATVEETERVLDLRTFPTMEGAKLSSIHSLGMIMYEAKGTPKEAFEFQKQELLKRGFKELPGGHSSDQTYTGKFTKGGFLISASASGGYGDPEKAGLSNVSIVNEGNVALNQLPVPPGVKPFHPRLDEASYTTEASPTETAAACRKLLMAAGWEPYGQGSVAHPDQPDASMQYFKRNAIKLQSWIMTTPAEGGKTLIRYNAEVLTADLPAPPDAADPRFDNDQKRLWFEAPAEQADAIIAFYQERLPKQGWKATTEKPIVDDRDKTQFLVYRNPQKDMISLDQNQYSGKVATTLRHQTAAEVAEEERLAKEQAELARQQAARENAKVNVAVHLPALAEKIDKKSANELEFTLPTGSGPETIKAFCEQLAKEGWKEQGERDLDDTSGHIILKKEYAQVTLSYFDLGISDVDVTVEGTRNVVLEPVPHKDAAAALAAKKPKVDAIDELLKKGFEEAREKALGRGKKPAPKKAEAKKAGVPTLPPGVELPADVDAILQRALKEADDAKQKAEKKQTP